VKVPEKTTGIGAANTLMRSARDTVNLSKFSTSAINADRFDSDWLRHWNAVVKLREQLVKAAEEGVFSRLERVPHSFTNS
jgi:hypothetical protein